MPTAGSPPLFATARPSLLVPVPLPAAPGSGAGRGHLAAIDVGSNSIHMIVVAPQPDGSYRVLDRERDMVRLGRSALSGAGRLSPRAMRDGLDALIKMTTLARLKGADRAVAVATSAVREADNGREFLQRVQAVTGLDVQLLSGEEEALLIHRAVAEVVDLEQGRAVVIDIGGGSTEWIATVDGQYETLTSLRLGSLRLARVLGEGDPPSASAIKRLRRHLRENLRGLPAGGPADLVIATSGTAVCAVDLADLAAGRDRESSTKGLRELRVKELSALITRLQKLRRREIAALPPVGEPRSESILPGCILLEELLKIAGVDRCQVSDRALRDGLVLEALGHPAPAGENQESRRRRQVLRLVERSPSLVAHHAQTARLAVRLFDLTAKLHGLGPHEREWLEHAAALHDIGHLINYQKHHKHSYYLITHAELDAFDAREIAVIAHVARYHRGSLPNTTKHPTFAALDRWQREVIVQLTALLRVADALDRTHAQRVEGLSAGVAKRRVVLDVSSPYDVDIERAAAHDRRELFETTFHHRLEIRQSPLSPP